MPNSIKIKNEKQQLIIILLIIFIGFVGTSIVYPIFPPLFLHPLKDSIIPFEWSGQTRSIVLGIALAAYPLGQFISSPIIGGYSDRHGRKPVLMISLIGSTMGYLFSALSFHFNCLWLLILSRFVTGLMEGNVAIVRAMAADLTHINKYKSFGRINAAASIGYVMGPMLGGFLSDSNLLPWFSFDLPFFLATLLSAITVVLAAKKLNIKQHNISKHSLTIGQRFNLVDRFKVLCKDNVRLKNLLIISSIFTFAIDIFYEFGPVYLTGLWSMSPAWIAIYNAVLSFSLALGSGWMAHRLSIHFPTDRVLTIAISLTALFFVLMTIWLSPLIAFILFGLVGLSIATGTTNLTIQLSNAAANTTQGEALGAQLSLRMLGDAIICLLGGIIIVYSAILPLVISAMVALISAALVATFYKKDDADIHHFILKKVLKKIKNKSNRASK